MDAIFAHFVNNLRLGRHYAHIIDEMQAMHGNIDEKTMRNWRRIYQESLGKAPVPLDALMIGGAKGDVVVMDETVVGTHPSDGWSFQTKSISKGGGATARTTPQGKTKKLVRKGVLKKLPARTLYKTQKVVKGSFQLVDKKNAPMKTTSKGKKRAAKQTAKPAKKTIGKKKTPKNQALKKRPAANLKSNGRWLWLGILVGNKSKVYTHANKEKMVTYRLLPCAADAQENKPRGFEEIRDTVQSRVRKGTTVAYDGRTSTESAVQELGYEHPPPVRHEGNVYRDKETGFHTNDAESENSRLKAWNRLRYGKLNITPCDMDEYIYYINVGSGMGAVLDGLAHSNEFVAKNKLLG